jgi:hypothetical protein
MLNQRSTKAKEKKFVLYILQEFEIDDVRILGFTEGKVRLSAVHCDKGLLGITRLGMRSVFFVDDDGRGTMRQLQ